MTAAENAAAPSNFRPERAGIDGGSDCGSDLGATVPDPSGAVKASPPTYPCEKALARMEDLLAKRKRTERTIESTRRKINQLRLKVEAAKREDRRLRDAIEIERRRGWVGCGVKIESSPSTSRWAYLNDKVGTLTAVNRSRAEVDFGADVGAAMGFETGVITTPILGLRLADDQVAQLADKVNLELQGGGR